MKYTNLLSKLGDLAYKALYGILMLIIVGLVGTMAFLSFWTGILLIAVMLMPLMIVFLGIGVNYCLGLICGDELYNTGYVHEGNSQLAIKTTPRYYKRKKFIDFFQCFLYVAYIVYFCFEIGSQPGLAITGIVVFLACAILYFIAGLSSIEKSKG